MKLLIANSIRNNRKPQKDKSISLPLYVFNEISLWHLVCSNFDTIHYVFNSFSAIFCGNVVCFYQPRYGKVIHVVRKYSNQEDYTNY